MLSFKWLLNAISFLSVFVGVDHFGPKQQRLQKMLEDDLDKAQNIQYLSSWRQMASPILDNI